MSFDADKARQMREAGMNWSEIARSLNTTVHHVRANLEPDYLAIRAERVRGYKQADRENHKALENRAKILGAPHRDSAAQRDWLIQLRTMPRDTRDITGRIFNDPIPGDPRTPWRPSSAGTTN